MTDDDTTRHDHPSHPDDPAGDEQTVEMASLTAGLEFGRYKIVRRIGSGGMGTVYAALDPTLDRTVALKVLHDKVESADAEQRLLREAQAMARLSHPNVVTVHDAGMKDGRPYVAMELVDGSDLRAWLTHATGLARNRQPVRRGWRRAGRRPRRRPGPPRFQTRQRPGRDRRPGPRHRLRPRPGRRARGMGGPGSHCLGPRLRPGQRGRRLGDA